MTQAWFHRCLLSCVVTLVSSLGPAPLPELPAQVPDEASLDTRAPQGDIILAKGGGRGTSSRNRPDSAGNEDFGQINWESHSNGDVGRAVGTVHGDTSVLSSSGQVEAERPISVPEGGVSPSIPETAKKVDDVLISSSAVAEMNDALKELGAVKEEVRTPFTPMGRAVAGAVAAAEAGAPVLEGFASAETVGGSAEHPVTDAVSTMMQGHKELDTVHTEAEYPLLDVHYKASANGRPTSALGDTSDHALPLDGHVSDDLASPGMQAFQDMVHAKDESAVAPPPAHHAAPPPAPQPNQDAEHESMIRSGVVTMEPALEEDPLLSMHHRRAPVSSAFGHAGSFVWLIIRVLFFIIMGGVIGVAFVLCLASHTCERIVRLVTRGSSTGGVVRAHVERLPVCRAAEVRQRLPAVSGGYDCTFSRPLSSRQLLRVEAYIRPLNPDSVLTAPLTQHSCVLYSSVVSRRLHDGVHPVPVAFHFASVSFCATLSDAPHVRIMVRGDDVSLFDIRGGRFFERRSSGRLQERWQDFISQHSTTSHLSGQYAAQQADTELEFQETALLVGSLVTLVGELHRGSDGELSMKPWPGACHAAALGDGRDEEFIMGGAESFGHKLGGSVKKESWQTSWEGSGPQPTSGPQVGQPEARIDKVLASDDPRLIELGGDAAGMVAGILSACRRGVTTAKLHLAQNERRWRKSWAKKQSLSH